MARLILLCALLVACGEGNEGNDFQVISATGNGEALDGDGKLTMQARDVRGFDAILSEVPLNVTVAQASEFKVEVAWDANFVAKVLTEVQGNTLHIHLEPGQYRSKLRGAVTVALPHLRALAAEGAGDIDARADELTPLTLRVGGSGDVRFVGNVDDLEVDASGSGSVTLSGAASRAELVASGSGDLDARGFTAVQGRIDSAGSGNVSATFTREVKAQSTGSGDVDLYGGASVSESEAGSGAVTVHGA